MILNFTEQERAQIRSESEIFDFRYPIRVTELEDGGFELDLAVDILAYGKTEIKELPCRNLDVSTIVEAVERTVATARQYGVLD